MMDLHEARRVFVQGTIFTQASRNEMSNISAVEEGPYAGTFRIRGTVDGVERWTTLDLNRQES
jgi:hypothetical protein